MHALVNWFKNLRNKSSDGRETYKARPWAACEDPSPRWFVGACHEMPGHAGAHRGVDGLFGGVWCWWGKRGPK